MIMESLGIVMERPRVILMTAMQSMVAIVMMAIAMVAIARPIAMMFIVMIPTVQSIAMMAMIAMVIAWAMDVAADWVMDIHMEKFQSGCPEDVDCNV